ncbi:hypothetical protein [Mesorhizobium sp.]|uniref:hypothetical protein n=1 Tax=Mesorhizobium sp. TaxID=1871066 RepID=UPI000FE731A4|nr:hypothetical protein [Mesorhizobium sp.]RWB84129.1 MAG: DNA-binding protein [Mesorhizobium sp.]
MQQHLDGPTGPEKLINIQAAAEAIGAKYWQIQRLARAGRIPVYRAFNSRPLVKLSEVVAYVDACREGGADER